METIFVLLPLALLFAGIALALFVWAARSGQFDDLETPAVRILFDDEPAPAPAPGGEQATPVQHTTEADQTRKDPV
jgi:cbb3-type cytochrome oxidase maturation protein